MSALVSRTEQPSAFRQRLEVRGHEIYADLPVDQGGEGSAPDAHDYFDASLAACQALTAMWFAKKNGIPLERVESRVERDDSEERRGRYKLSVQLGFHGPLTEDDRSRLYAAVARCPVSKLMTTTEVVIETSRLPPREPAYAPKPEEERRC